MNIKTQYELIKDRIDNKQIISKRDYQYFKRIDNEIKESKTFEEWEKYYAKMVS